LLLAATKEDFLLSNTAAIRPFLLRVRVQKMQFLAQRKESILITEINELMLISGTNPALSENRICEDPGGSGGFE
jgi:hypothetical protein